MLMANCFEDKLAWLREVGRWLRFDYCQFLGQQSLSYDTQS